MRPKNIEENLGMKLFPRGSGKGSHLRCPKGFTTIQKEQNQVVYDTILMIFSKYKIMPIIISSKCLFLIIIRYNKNKTEGVIVILIVFLVN